MSDNVVTAADQYRTLTLTLTLLILFSFYFSLVLLGLFPLFYLVALDDALSFYYFSTTRM